MGIMMLVLYLKTKNYHLTTNLFLISFYTFIVVIILLAIDKFKTHKKD
jgi:hypothetical protein